MQARQLLDRAFGAGWAVQGWSQVNQMRANSVEKHTRSGPAGIGVLATTIARGARVMAAISLTDHFAVELRDFSMSQTLDADGLARLRSALDHGVSAINLSLNGSWLP